MHQTSPSPARSSPGPAPVPRHGLDPGRDVQHGLRASTTRRNARSIASTVDGFWMDRTPVTERRVSAVRRGDRARHVRRDSAEPGRLPGREARTAASRLARVRQAAEPGRSRATSTTGGRFMLGADWRHPRGPELDHQGPRGSSGRPTSRSATPRRTRRGQGRRCRPRPSGSSPRAAGSMAPSTPGATSFSVDGKLMANFWQGEFPWQNLKRRRLRRHVAGRRVSAERLRPGRHDRQRLGVDDRLVHRRSIPTSRIKACCIPAESARRRRNGKLRSAPAARSGFRARSSRAARTAARRTTAADIGRRRGSPSRSTRRRVISASAASCGRRSPPRRR